MADGSNSAPPPQTETSDRIDNDTDPCGSMFDGTVFERNWTDTSAQDELVQKKAWMREVAYTLTEPSPINRNDRQHER